MRFFFCFFFSGNHYMLHFHFELRCQIFWLLRAAASFSVGGIIFRRQAKKDGCFLFASLWRHACAYVISLLLLSIFSVFPFFTWGSLSFKGYLLPTEFVIFSSGLRFSRIIIYSKATTSTVNDILNNVRERFQIGLTQGTGFAEKVSIELVQLK